MKARNKIYVTILLSIILFVLVKLTFPIANDGQLLRDSFWVKKTYTPKKYNIIVCGDSRVYRGFSTTAMKNVIKSPLKGINLGYSSAGFDDYYFDFITSKLDFKEKEQILILGITPNSLTEEAFKNDHLKSYQKLSGMELYKAKYLANLLKYLVPYQPTDFLNKKIIYNEKIEYKSDGWAATSWVKKDSTYALKSYRTNFKNHHVSEREVEVFLRNIEKIKKKGIKIVAYRPPSTLQMRILEDSLSGFNEKRIKEELINRGVIWIDFKDSDFKSFDGSHLEIQSAEKLSRQIGKYINELYLKDQD